MFLTQNCSSSKTNVYFVCVCALKREYHKAKSQFFERECSHTQGFEKVLVPKHDTAIGFLTSLTEHTVKPPAFLKALLSEHTKKTKKQTNKKNKKQKQTNKKHNKQKKTKKQ